MPAAGLLNGAHGRINDWWELTHPNTCYSDQFIIESEAAQPIRVDHMLWMRSTGVRPPHDRLQGHQREVLWRLAGWRVVILRAG